VVRKNKNIVQRRPPGFGTSEGTNREERSGEKSVSTCDGGVGQRKSSVPIQRRFVPTGKTLGHLINPVAGNRGTRSHPRRKSGKIRFLNKGDSPESAGIARAPLGPTFEASIVSPEKNGKGHRRNTREAGTPQERVRGRQLQE